MSPERIEPRYMTASRNWMARVALLRPFDRQIVPLVLLIAFAWVVNWLMGKDINADFIAYHMYAAHALLGGHHQSDFMAAGPQSYLNPAGYVPFYLMLKANWPALLVSTVMATVHSLNLVVLWKLCRDHLFAQATYRNALSFLAVMLGAISPVFFATLGSSFLDPMLSVLVLGGLLLIAQASTSQPSRARLLLGAGLLFGVAAGLKLTNGIFAVAALIAIQTLHGTLYLRIQRAAMFSLAVLAGLAMASGWWSWMLWEQFGNPVFPLFNGIFKSPDFPAVSVTHDRFAPHGIWDFLMLPLRMMKMNSGIYVEILAPDIRAGVLLILAGATALVATYRRTRAASVNPVPVSAVAIQVAIFFLVAWALLFGTSGNGRYAIPLLLLLGPLIVYLLHFCFRREGSTLAVATILVVLQGLHGYKGEYPRWDAAPWTRNWVDVALPKQLTEKPAAYLSLSTVNLGVLFHHMSAGSSFVSLVGFEPLSPDGAGSARIRQFIDRNEGNLRILIQTEDKVGSEWFQRGQVDPVLAPTVARMLAPWGLRLVNHDCAFAEISMHGGAGAARTGNQANLLGIMLISCPVQAGPGEDEAMRTDRAWATTIFDRVSSACPLLFPPPGGFPQKAGEAWIKRFAGTDTILSIFSGNVQHSRFPFGPFGVDLGNASDWAVATQPIACKYIARPW